MPLTELVQKIRPAPLQVLVAKALRLNKRRVFQFGDFRFFVDPASHFGSHIANGNYEADMIATLARYLKPGGTFLDVGANEGFFSVLAGRIVGASGRVVAIEPQARLQDTIKKNFALNNSDNCQVEQCVLGGVSGLMTIHLSPETNTGSTSLFPTARYKLQKETVQCWNFEDFLARAGLDHVDLVKMDIEGAEYDVIMSSGEILKSGRIKVIALEYHPVILEHRGLSMPAIHNLLTASGYQLVESDGNSIYEFAA